MSRVWTFVLIALGLLFGAFMGAAPGHATCDPTTDPDKTDIVNARAAVAANCNCAGATSHGAYVSCAVQQANLTLSNKSCAGAVKRCAAHSTCGKPAGAVTCCVTKASGTKCKIKRDAAHCKAPPGATACVGSYTSCCDACSVGGCATTTTTTTPQPCGFPPSCNGTCDPGMGCAISNSHFTCLCFPDATCQGQLCTATPTMDCSQAGGECPPGYGCVIEPGGSVCLGPPCGPGCFCPSGGVCVVP